MSLLLVGILANSAFAAPSPIKAWFGGVCNLTNLTGACTIKATASDGSETLWLQMTSGGITGNYGNFGRTRIPDGSGFASWRFRNIPIAGTCYRVKNMTTKVKSNAICIK